MSVEDRLTFYCGPTKFVPLKEGKMSFRARVVQAAGRNIEDLLTDKRVWAAAFGLLMAINQWLGWQVPVEVFVTAQALILALVLAWKDE